jgi:hypothetical protein
MEYDKRSLDDYIPIASFSSKMIGDLVFSKLNMEWSPVYNAWFSKDKVGLSNILRYDINSQLDGFVEVLKTEEKGDVVNVFIQASADSWYFFGYEDRRLIIYSSNEEFNEVIRDKSNVDKAAFGEYVFVEGDMQDALKFIDRFRYDYLDIKEPYEINVPMMEYDEPADIFADPEVEQEDEFDYVDDGFGVEEDEGFGLDEETDISNEETEPLSVPEETKKDEDPGFGDDPAFQIEEDEGFGTEEKKPDDEPAIKSEDRVVEEDTPGDEIIPSNNTDKVPENIEPLKEESLPPPVKEIEVEEIDDGFDDGFDNQEEEVKPVQQAPARGRENPGAALEEENEKGKKKKEKKAKKSQERKPPPEEEKKPEPKPEIVEDDDDGF